MSMAPAYNVNDNLNQQPMIYSFSSEVNEANVIPQTFTIPNTAYIDANMLQVPVPDQHMVPNMNSNSNLAFQTPLNYPGAFVNAQPPGGQIFFQPVLNPGTVLTTTLQPQQPGTTTNQLFGSQQPPFQGKPPVTFLPTNQTTTTLAPTTSFYPQPTPLTFQQAPQPAFFFPSSSSSVCPTLSAGCSSMSHLPSRSHHLTVENPSRRTSTARSGGGRSTRGNSVARSRTPELRYFQVPQTDRQHLNTLGSVPEHLTARPRDPAKPSEGTSPQRRYGYRSKQRKIEQTRSWIKNEFDRQGLFAEERELVRGPDTVRVHVKTYEGLTDIKQALIEVQNHEQIQIVRVACPFSKKNKFQKKGYIVYLKVLDESQVPLVQNIFARYKKTLKNCVIAVPKRDRADPTHRGTAVHVNESKKYTPVLDSITIDGEDNYATSTENPGSVFGSEIERMAQNEYENEVLQ
jgi:hypothetical protein